MNKTGKGAQLSNTVYGFLFLWPFYTLYQERALNTFLGFLYFLLLYPLSITSNALNFPSYHTVFANDVRSYLVCQCIWLGPEYTPKIPKVTNYAKNKIKQMFQVYIKLSYKKCDITFLKHGLLLTVLTGELRNFKYKITILFYLMHDI